MILHTVALLQYRLSQQKQKTKNNNKKQQKNKKQAINEYTNSHPLKTYSLINLTFDNNIFRR